MSTQTSAGASGLDGFFKITERGSNVGREIRGGVVTFFTMALHRRAEPDHHRLRARRRGQVPRRRRRPQHRGHRGRDGPGRRAADHPHGRLRQLPAGTGHRARAQRVRGVHHRQPDDLGRRDGARGHRGHHHPGPGLHRVPDRGLPRRTRPAQGRDLGRHRPVHRSDRLRRRRVRRGARVTAAPAGPRGQPAAGLAGAGLRCRPRPGHRPVGAQGQGRHPHHPSWP